MNTVALRYQAIYLDVKDVDMSRQASPAVLAFVARLRERGYTLTEELFRALCAEPATTLADITRDIDEALGVNLNWAPLVKGWDVPTGETFLDHLVTWFVNVTGADVPGIELPCGHLIPDGTFPLERYNGCPYCGRPFVIANYVFKGQGSKLKELRLFRLPDMQHLLETLLTSPTPLDATQLDSVKRLIHNLPFTIHNGVVPQMRETRMVVIKCLMEQGRGDEAQPLMETPADVLRYLWYEKTGQLQIIEPRTLIAHAGRLNRHLWPTADRSQEAIGSMRDELRLKYNRTYARCIARWLNSLSMSASQAAEQMHPKRGMWVRMIRALRLGEMSRKPGFERLRELLDVFYHQNYNTWQGQLDAAHQQNDRQKALALLCERPGLFARCLFSTMLRYGREETLQAFSRVTDKLPARLLLSLSNAAETYFDPEGFGGERIVRPITGTPKAIALNKMLSLYDLKERRRMADSIEEIYLQTMTRRFAQQGQKEEGSRVYIDKELYHIPLAVGDRSTTIQDTACALQGTCFQVEGDSVRLFLQWGKGLPAQHLDMDLSARIVKRDGEVVECAFYNLAPTGAKHSGDIREIPDQVGTAEYVELELPELERSEAEYVVFTCNAYSNGALSPNLMVGWMNSAYPMSISDKDGVAYDPSCVQHLVRISEANLSKGLVFGILKVREREIVWMEVPFTAQTVAQLDGRVVEAMLRRLEHKATIGQLLELKAHVQKSSLVETPDEADERYTYEWALNPAEVAKVLFL